ncbi:hypothetical protein R3I93_015656 [Phoxinus phoxinus]|uniref:Interleukin-2 n=1 Tax=Phoxinus phoxinus TaxID=58324 RepID=A0AAN9CP04_9TELE
MRSLSLESIPVNKNMKLLILLVALLVRTNPSLSKPTPNYHPILHEIKDDLYKMRTKMNLTNEQHKLKQLLTAFSNTEKIQTPRDLKNACECEAQFFQHLKDALMLVEEVLPVDEIANILDNLDELPTVKKPNDNCNFTTFKLRDASLKNDLIQDNIDFIENWNTNCKPKSHKRN